jgi:hypothetical protein
VIVGRLIPAGTGLAYHEERRTQPKSERRKRPVQPAITLIPPSALGTSLDDDEDDL